MFSLKFLVLVCSAHAIMGQFLPMYAPEEGSSEEQAGQAPGARGTSCRCGWTNKQGRIVGGKQVLPNEFPLMAGIKKQWGGLFCGGSIITEKHVLTAAHCTIGSKGDRLFVVVGTHDVSQRGLRSDTTQIVEVDYTVEHENYNSKTFANDVAVMVLKTPIKFNQYVGPVCMPTERTNLINKWIKVIGWGYMNYRTREVPNHLMKVNLKVIDTNECNYFKQAFGLHVSSKNQICTYRRAKDSCNGDSGGPLVWLDPETNRLTQIALVSYGSPKCGESKPAVNTNVYDYLPWIKNTISASSRGYSVCQKV